MKKILLLVVLVLLFAISKVNAQFTVTYSSNRSAPNATFGLAEPTPSNTYSHNYFIYASADSPESGVYVVSAKVFVEIEDLNGFPTVLVDESGTTNASHGYTVDFNNVTRLYEAWEVVYSDGTYESQTSIWYP